MDVTITKIRCPLEAQLKTDANVHLRRREDGQHFCPVHGPMNDHADKLLADEVNDAWYERTKGDLMLNPSDPDQHDPDLWALVKAMRDEAVRIIAMTASAQHDAAGDEIAEVDDDEIANRIAASLDLLFYGGRR